MARAWLAHGSRTQLLDLDMSKAHALLSPMAFLHVPQPSGTGFFVFPTDPENIQARAAHDFTRVYPVPAFERHVDPRTSERLKTRVGGGRLAIVGLWPEDAILKKWELIVGGETVFFLTKDSLAAHGTIVLAERSRSLAEQLFGRGAGGGHELLTFLVDVSPLQRTLAQFNEALGRKGGQSFRGFTTVSTDQ